MDLTFFDSEEDAAAAAETLRTLGPAAKKLLAECVEKQELIRNSLSPTAEALNNAGFIFIREDGWGQFQLSPSLAGEDALTALEVSRASSMENRNPSN
jgi:hypothetical protein